MYDKSLRVKTSVRLYIVIKGSPYIDLMLWERNIALGIVARREKGFSSVLWGVINSAWASPETLKGSVKRKSL